MGQLSKSKKKYDSDGDAETVEFNEHIVICQKFKPSAIAFTQRSRPPEPAAGRTNADFWSLMRIGAFGGF